MKSLVILDSSLGFLWVGTSRLQCTMFKCAYTDSDGNDGVCVLNEDEITSMGAIGLDAMLVFQPIGNNGYDDDPDDPDYYPDEDDPFAPGSEVDNPMNIANDDLHDLAEQLGQDDLLDMMGDDDVLEVDEKGKIATDTTLSCSTPTYSAAYPESVHEGRPLVDLSQEE